jgi:type IV secretory pathway VirB10-like protein
MHVEQIMRRTLIAIAVLSMLGASPAFAIYKCKIDGRITFQDRPCEPGAGGAIEVRPSSLPAPAPAEPVATETVPSDSPVQNPMELQRSKVDDMRTRAEAAEKERKGREIDHKIKIVEQKMRNLEDAQASELAALSRKKNRARNNLAGATWEASISQEQQAVMSKYESRMKNERSKLEMLVEQRGRL